MIKDKNNIPRLIKNLGKGGTVKIGYMGEGETAMIAAVHEFGVVINVTDKMRNFLHTKGIHLKPSTTQITIPERSFLRAGWDENEDQVLKRLDTFLDEALTKNVRIDKVLEAMGIEAKGKIQKYAKSLSSPANSPATVASKGSSNPLVDTGNLIQSIDYTVDK